MPTDCSGKGNFGGLDQSLYTKFQYLNASQEKVKPWLFLAGCSGATTQARRRSRRGKNELSVSKTAERERECEEGRDISKKMTTHTHPNLTSDPCRFLVVVPRKRVRPLFFSFLRFSLRGSGQQFRQPQEL